MAELIRIGAICEVRGSKDDWRVIDHRFDGKVYKYVVQSLYSGTTKCVFSFEVFEKYTSTYKELNDFLFQVTGLGMDDMRCFDDEMIDPTTILKETTHDIDLDPPKPPIVSVENNAVEPPKKKRFKESTDESVSKLRAQNTEYTTDKQTKWAVTLFKDWMKEAGYASDSFELLEASALDEVLQKFYASVQTKKGDDYSKAGLVGIRAGINRCLTTPPVSRQINIMKDRDFMFSNQVLSGLVKGLKREGKDISKHKEPITEDDVNKLFESGVFTLGHPRTLQNKVIFDIISQFGRRGQEGLHDLRKDSFVVNTDSKGRRYIKMAYNEADKTHHCLDHREDPKEPRLYENGGDRCPMRSYLKYMSKLHPECPSLFQRPLDKFQVDNEIWYANKPVGISTLRGFMARLSDTAGLSQRYTNHCVRAFVGSHLHKQGFSSRAIMSVTGHRNVSSLNSYVKPSDEERYNISKTLNYAGCSSNAENVPPICETTPELPEQPQESEGTSSIQTTRPEPKSKCPNVSSVTDSRALNMLTGNISSSTITVLKSFLCLLVFNYYVLHKNPCLFA